MRDAVTVTAGRGTAPAGDRTLIRLPRGLPVAAAAMLPLALLAFWPGYLSKFGAADGYTHVHAALGTGWLLLLIAQPLLVRRRAFRWHRLLGRVGIVAGCAFFVSGVLTAHRGLARMGAEQFEREGHFVYLPLAMAVIFGAALLLGVAWRSAPSVHARFMACTLLPLLDPLFARILFFHFPPLPAEFLYQVPAFALAAAVLIALAVTVPPTARGRNAFRGYSVGAVLILLLYFATPSSAAWMSFARWFRSLPLT